MKRIIDVFRKLDNTWVEANKTFKNETEKLKHYYGNSRAFGQKYAEIKNLFDETMSQAKQEAFKQTEVIFNDINSKIMSFVQQPAPDGFISTFETIKALGKEITEQEAKTYFDMYRDNYIASRSLSAYFYKSNGYFLIIPTVDAINEEIQSYYNQAKDFINNYEGSSYVSALFTTDKNNPWELPALKIDSFITGNTEEIAEVFSDDELAEALKKMHE